jgi:hypothetical protein
MKMFVFQFLSYGDYSFAVIAKTREDAADAIARTHSWTREELLADPGHFQHEEYAPLEVAEFAN